MKYYLSSFGLHNPFINIDFADHLVYPIANEFQQGFDLDYGMLLVGESFIIDKAAFDFIVNDSRIHLSLMANSLNTLYNEGFLEFYDLENALLTRKDELIKKTEILANDYKDWLQIVRDQWSQVNKNRTNYVNRYGTIGKELINSNHFTLVNAIKKRTGSINPAEIQHYQNIIFSNKHKFTSDEKEVIIELLKPLICHILIHDLARYESKTAILDWDDSARYYDRLYSARWDHDSKEDQVPGKARQIFNLLLPQLKPSMVNQVIKFINDKGSVNSLRSEIIEIINQGAQVDEKWLIQYQNQVYKSGLKKEHTMKYIRLGSSFLGLFIPGGSLIADALKEGASTVIESGIEGGISKTKYDWYYALQNNIITKV